MWWHRCLDVYVTTLLRLLQVSPHLHHMSLRHISLHLCYGSHHSYITGTTSMLGHPHSYIIRHYVCDTGIPTSVSYVTTSVIRASSQQCHYVCDTGIPTATSYVTASVIWASAQLLRRHCVCDMSVPTVMSYVTTPVTRASLHLHHTSLHLWYGCPHSYITGHYVCDTGIPTSTSYVTASVIWVSPDTSYVTASDIGVPTSMSFVCVGSIGG